MVLDRLHTFLFLLVLPALPGTAAAEGPSWPVEFYDPEAARGIPADLVLPMPCGGGMAFQKITVPAEAGNPLSDRLVRLGASDPESGHLDYFVKAYLRGAFSEVGTGNTHYFIGRYELTSDQHAAIRNDCAEPSIRGRIPKLGLSWFDAVDLTRTYTEWLRAEASASLPVEDGFPAFVRLPTETEWEYATRGGVRVEASTFGSRLFPMEEGIDFYAWHHGSSRGQPRPVGTRRPNPLGLFDVYGNAEELILEPFRMNVLGRPHGQPGGVVTRGASYRSTAEQMYSARRSEWPLFRITDGHPSAEDTFGARFVLSTHVSVSDARVSRIQDSWMDSFRGPAGDVEDPIAEVTSAIEGETDERRKARLLSLRELIRDDRRRREEAELRILRSTLMNGAVLVRVIRDSNRAIERFGRVQALLIVRVNRANDADERSKLGEQLNNAKAEIARLQPIRADALRSYAQTLESAVSSLDPDLLIGMRDTLRLELRASGQDRMLTLVEDFHRDYELYSEKRDMSQSELLEAAIAP
ncbi:MAG: SUMF1/EgtB/PvdO family nonheme iron enzyme [Paracoccaceae bacterium]|nr:SUMF1/EgtB/PvdO family nonheme iron enzyme [Paracoccaceae bacterium]